MRDDRSAEHPGEGVVHRRLEFALDPRGQPPLATHVLPFACTCRRYCRCAANESPACWFTPAWYRHIATARHCRNSENWVPAAQGCACGEGRAPNGIQARCGGSGIGPLQWYGPSVVFPGEWRNGRRAGFRCQCPSGRGGSSPPSPTLSGAKQSHDLARGRGFRVWGDRDSGYEPSLRYVPWPSTIASPSKIRTSLTRSSFWLR